MKRAISTTLTFYFTLSYFLIISSAITFFWWFSSQHFNDMDKQYILNKGEMVIASLDNNTWGQSVDLTEILYNHSDISVVALRKGQLLAQSSFKLVDIPALLLDGEPGRLIDWKNDTFHFKGIATVVNNVSGETFRLIVIRDVSNHAEFLSRATKDMVLIMSLMFVALNIIGTIISWYGLAPLRRFSLETSKIDVNTLSTRLDQEEYPKEMQSSIKIFNLMLKRLERSFDQLSFYAANLAHELRTPLASMTVSNQCMLQGERSSDEYKDILASNIEELEFLSKTVTDVLLMAKAESEQLIVMREHVDIYELSSMLAEYFQLLADEKNVEIIIQGHGELNTDKGLIRRVIGNLLSNAVQHADDDSKILITIEDRANNIELAVSNAGTEIPPDDCEHLFDRNFTRNKYTSVNLGIGLTLSRALLTALGGSIRVESAQHSTRFVIGLPKNAEAKDLEDIS